MLGVPVRVRLLVVLCAAATLTVSAQDRRRLPSTVPPPFSVVEATIAAMRAALEKGGRHRERW